jgi:hypothetical protein
LYHLDFGVSLRLTLRSWPDRRSTWVRRSPVSPFSSSERVSFPDRLSLAIRLSPDRFRSSVIACLRLVVETRPGGADYRRLQARKRPAPASHGYRSKLNAPQRSGWDHFFVGWPSPLPSEPVPASFGTLIMLAPAASAFSRARAVSFG